MKHFAKLFLVMVMACICSSAVAQQNFKFGHINAQELIMMMPERDSASVRMENYGRELQDQIEAMQVEFNNKLNVYQQRHAEWSASILEMRQRELQELQVRIQEFQQTAQEDFQRMQQVLLRPVIDRANNAIEAVGKREGFIYIFDISSGSIPFFNTEHSVDVLPLVRQELNIPASARPAGR